MAVSSPKGGGIAATGWTVQGGGVGGGEAPPHPPVVGGGRAPGQGPPQHENSVRGGWRSRGSLVGEHGGVVKWRVRGTAG